MPQIVIPIYFDYASTLCYVAWRIVGQLERELGFTALWKGVPIALRNYRTRPGLPLGPLELGQDPQRRRRNRHRGRAARAMARLGQGAPGLGTRARGRRVRGVS